MDNKGDNRMRYRPAWILSFSYSFVEVPIIHQLKDDKLKTIVGRYEFVTWTNINDIISGGMVDVEKLKLITARASIKFESVLFYIMYESGVVLYPEPTVSMYEELVKYWGDEYKLMSMDSYIIKGIIE